MPAAQWLRMQDARTAGPRVVEVLACNWDAYRAYALCQPTVVGGGMAVVWLGVAAAETRAACTLLRIPRGRWPDVAEQVQYLGERVAAALNQRARR